MPRDAHFADPTRPAPLRTPAVHATLRPRARVAELVDAADSKSAFREEVRVRVPSLVLTCPVAGAAARGHTPGLETLPGIDELREAQARGEEDLLGRLLVPRLLVELSRATEELERLREELAAPRQVDGDPSRELEAVGERVEELGWCLALVASAAGMDLVLERREERGLLVVVELLARALSDDGVELEHGAGPAWLAPGVPRGWSLPWAVASLLLAAVLEGGAGRYRWSVEPGQECWRVRLPGGRAPADLWNEVVAGRLDGARLEAVEEGLALVTPAGWWRSSPRTAGRSPQEKDLPGT